MNRKVMFRFWFVFVIVALGLLPTISLQAQEPGLTETFDDPTLPGWEHSPNVAVVDGVLRIEPGNFAFHGGEWEDFTLTVRVQRPGEGEVVLSYRAGDAGTYHLILGPDFLILQREARGAITELGNAAPISIPTGEWFQLGLSVADDKHTVTLDNEPALSATDSDPLPPGGIGFEILGGGTGEFDDLLVTAGGAISSPEPESPGPETEEADESPAEAPAEAPSASDLTWVRTGGPPGGLGYDIRYKFDDPNTWYVTDNFAGVHVSTDNGLTWQPCNTGIPPQLGPTGDWIPIFSLTIDPHNPQIIWAGTDKTGHIYRSTDGGRTWEQRDNGVTIEHDTLTFRGFTVDPRSSDIVYAMGETTDEALGGPAVWGSGTGGIVYKTTNGGEHWEKIWGEPPPSSLARYMWIDPRNLDVLYVSTGIFDRGAVGEGDPRTDPFGGLGILKSTDGGETWRVLGEDNGLRMLYLGSLFMHPDNPDILLAAAGHTLEGPAVEYIENLVAAGETAPSGVYRTTDGGEHWTQVLISGPELAGENFSSVELCPSDPNIAYAGSASAVYRSEDAGQTWKLVSGGVEGWGPPGIMAGWPIDMQCDPRDPNRIFANNYNGGNFLSEDGGHTWQNASNGYTGAQIRGVAVAPHEPGRVYAAGRSGLWRTDNGGTSWYGRYYPPADNPFFGLEWQAIAVDPGQPNHVLAGNIVSTVIIESEDGGSSWQVRWSLDQISGELPAGIEGQAPGVIVFAPSNPTTVYTGICSDMCVMGHEPLCDLPGVGIIVSHDGGTSWERAVDENLGDKCVLDLAVDPTDAQSVYAAAATGLFKSIDGGGTWTQLSGLPEDLLVRTVAVSPNDAQYVLAGIEGMGVYVSTDGGSTWQEGVAGLEANGSLHDIVFDPTNPQVVYTSDYFSGVYRSTDGGLTWLKIKNGLRNRAAMGLSISADGQHLYATTDGEGVYRLDLGGQPPQPVPGATPVISPTPTPVAAAPTSTPPPAQPTAPPEVAPSPTPEPPEGRGICGSVAALPLALLGIVWLRSCRR